ncbi:unnamed protein product, partial [Ectocarpus fasciculatus]
MHTHTTFSGTRPTRLCLLSRICMHVHLTLRRPGRSNYFFPRLTDTRPSQGHNLPVSACSLACVHVRLTNVRATTQEVPAPSSPNLKHTSLPQGGLKRLPPHTQRKQAPPLQVPAPSPPPNNYSTSIPSTA